MTRESLKWMVCPPPTTHQFKYFVSFWEDKHGHYYFYDPVGDLFYHQRVPVGEKALWSKSNAGIGR